MAEPIVLGIVGIKNMGVYNSQTQYEKLNVVTYNGSSYCALQNTKGNLPTNSDYWQLYASKGDVGPEGPQGPKPVKGVDYYTTEDKLEIESDLADDISDAVSESVGSLVSATPLAASSTTEMTDTTRIYVNTTDGKWYYYDGDSWEIGGTYQATEIADGSISRIMLDNGLNYELDKIDDIIGYLPHNEDITLSTYDAYIAQYAGSSATWVGFGVAISNPLILAKIKAPIYMTGPGIVRCLLLDSNKNELAHKDVTILTPDSNPYNFTEFDFNYLNTSSFGSYFYVCFTSNTPGVTLCRTTNYTLNEDALPSIEKPFIAKSSQWSTLGAEQYLFGLPIILYDNVLIKNDLSTFNIPTIYKAQFSDDITLSPPTTLYLDSILKSKQDCYTENKTDKMYLKTENTSNISGNIYSLNESHYLYSNTYKTKNFTIATKTIKTSSLNDKTAVVLQIGDSVTYGAGSQFNTDTKPNTSWGYMAWLGKKYLNSYSQIGSSCWETITLSDDTQYVAKAEGHGGWKLSDYLYLENVTASGSTTINPFYDGNKTWNNADLNTAGVKFSLNKYLTSKSLTTPTHVIIQLGFNDTAGETFITNMEYIIAAIKEEYPTMIIGLSLPRDYGTWYNEYYPLLVNNASGVHGTLLTKLQNWLEDYINLEDIENDIYFIPNYFVTPTGDSIPTHDINDKNVAFRNDSGYHPNHKAHVEWGLQQFAWLAYTLLK